MHREQKAKQRKCRSKPLALSGKSKNKYPNVGYLFSGERQWRCSNSKFTDWLTGMKNKHETGYLSLTSLLLGEGEKGVHMSVRKVRYSGERKDGQLNPLKA